MPGPHEGLELYGWYDDSDASYAEAIQKLEALYATLPTIACQGLCWNACGPVNMSIAEHRRVREAGVELPPYTRERSEQWNRGAPLHCPALDQFHRCTVYEARPLICRIWGNGRGDLACPYGCERTGPRLQLNDIMELMRQAFIIGGDADMHWGDIDRRLLDDPQVQHWLKVWMSGNRTIGPQLQAAVRAAQQQLGGNKNG